MYKRARAVAQPKKKKNEHKRKRDIIVNFRMSSEERMEFIEAELKRVVSADALDMGKLAGMKALVELFETVEE